MLQILIKNSKHWRKKIEINEDSYQKLITVNKSKVSYTKCDQNKVESCTR